MDIHILKEIPLFKTLSQSSLENQIKTNQIYQRHYSKGVTLYNANDFCDTLDIVIKGTLVAYSLSLNGSSTIMFDFNKGSFIGANLLFGNAHYYPFNIYCLSDCQIIHLRKNAIDVFLHNYHFTRLYIKSISYNSQGINRKIEMFSQKTLRENMLDYFKQQSMVQNSAVILLPMSKKQLADYLGVQRPSLFRELKNLKDEGVIDVNNRTITLKKI
jgi:CRP-like cAMP-binding protein